MVRVHTLSTELEIVETQHFGKASWYKGALEIVHAINIVASVLYTYYSFSSARVMDMDSPIQTNQASHAALIYKQTGGGVPIAQLYRNATIWNCSLACREIVRYGYIIRFLSGAHAVPYTCA